MSAPSNLLHVFTQTPFLVKFTEFRDWIGQFCFCYFEMFFFLNLASFNCNICVTWFFLILNSKIQSFDQNSNFLEQFFCVLGIWKGEVERYGNNKPATKQVAVRFFYIVGFLWQLIATTLQISYSTVLLCKTLLHVQQLD